jgi:PAS domain S-box-containing protein
MRLLMRHRDPDSSHHGQFLIGSLCLTAFALMGLVWWYYARQTQILESTFQHELAAVAEVKARQVTNWRNERIGDGRAIGSSANMRVARRILVEGHGTETDRADVLDLMNRVAAAFGYADAAVVDREGNPRVQLHMQTGNPRERFRALAQSAFRTRDVMLSDLYRETGSGRVLMSVVIPVEDLGAYILDIDSTQFLYPYIESGPTQSRTAETFLVRRDGEVALDLNDLHHAQEIPNLRGVFRSVPGLSPRSTLTDTAFKVLDARGVQVLLTVRQVAGSPWYIIGKIDAGEADLAVRRLGWQMALLVILIAAANGAGCSFIWRSHRGRVRREQNSHHREMADQTPAYLWNTSGGAGNSFVNQPLANFFGIADIRLGDGWHTYIHPDEAESARAEFQRCLDAHCEFTYEFRVRRFDGQYRWMISRGSPRFSKKSDFLGYAGSLTDITERKRAEELLRESEQRFRTIFENEGLGTSLVNRQGHPIKCNPAIQKMLGFTEQELRSMAFTEFTHPDDIDLDWRLYSELVDGKRDKYEIEKRYFKKDGQMMWGHLTASLVKHGDGAPADYTVGMVEDITERKRAEGELRAAHNQLTKELAERTQAEAEIVRLSVSLINAQEEERTRIARELHDDFSQQIAALGIALSNIKRQIPEDRREAREQAERAYDRVLAIGEGMRHLSHQLHPSIIEHSGLVPALESYCVEFESLTKVSATVQAKGPFDDLSANATLGIFRIAQEALQNIWKHSGVREAGIILARAGKHVGLQISDRGIGFDPAQPSKDAGLGLVSMRERAKLLGGMLTVESSAGQGTTIIVDIPVKSCSPAKASD